MATYCEISNELEKLRAKWRSMTDEERSSSDGLAMEERAKNLKERLVTMEAAVESYCREKFKKYHENMEILEQGSDVSKTATCPFCGCVYKYQPGEVSWGTTEVYNVPPEFRKCNGGEYDPCEVRHYRYVKCPNCKRENKI